MICSSVRLIIDQQGPYKQDILFGNCTSRRAQVREGNLPNPALQLPSLSLPAPGLGSLDTLGEFSLTPQQTVVNRNGLEHFPR